MSKSELKRRATQDPLWAAERIAELIEENERLKAEGEFLAKCNASLEGDNSQLKSLLERARKYIHCENGKHPGCYCNESKLLSEIDETLGEK